MHKRFRIILFFIFITNILAAQSEGILVQGVSPDLYMLHTVAPKENWYSLGRLYNISPKEIAPYNAVTIDKPLSIGQQIKIPLNIVNFSQNGHKVADEVFIPVYHIVQDKEWMYRISTNYNKVPIENLEKWNNITKDQVKAGMKLIVGYLKVKKDQSALAAKGSATIQTGTPTIITPPVVEAQERKTGPVVKQENKMEKQIPVPEEKKTLESRQVSQPGTINTNGGYFRLLYEESGKAALGYAGVFKSTSGWQDGKYYALVNNVPIGTIVKVSNPSTNKTVYAKVLGQLPDMKESVGLVTRISDAAAAELGTAGPRFTVDIKY